MAEMILSSYLELIYAFCIVLRINKIRKMNANPNSARSGQYEMKEINVNDSILFLTSLQVFRIKAGGEFS